MARSPADYRELLRTLQAERDLKQHEFARLLGRSPAWLSQILNARRSLHPDLAADIADRLRLPERRRLQFLSLVERDFGKSAFRRSFASDVLDGLELPEPSEQTEPAFRVHLRQWQVGAVLELSECEDYVPEASWIAAILRPSTAVEHVQGILELLRDHGYLDDHFRRRKAPNIVSTEREIRSETESQMARQLHEETLNLARQALDFPPEDRLLVSASVALSERDYQRLRARLAEVLAQTLHTAAQETPNRVYQLNLALFPTSLYTDEDPRKALGDADEE